MIQVKNEIEIYEVDGREPSTPAGQKKPTIVVESHWSKGNMVVIRLGDKSFTVAGSDMAAAIENASNRGRL